MVVTKGSGDINIPMDLMVKILKKLPAKSLARFRCVSYQWKSTINNFIVIDSIVTRSLTQPPRDPCFIFSKRSSSEPYSTLSCAHLDRQITNEEQLYHEETFGKIKRNFEKGVQHVRGLIGFWCIRYFRFAIHNPTTKQSLSLPCTRLTRSVVSNTIIRKAFNNLFYLFGYDPFKNQYKVLCLTKSYVGEQPCKVFILRDPSKQWRDIECSIGNHSPYGESVCINGKIYYQAFSDSVSSPLVSFDVRSEKFNHIRAPEDMPVEDCDDPTLLNYQGKLGCIVRNTLNEDDVDLWVMENAEKQEWSKITYHSMLEGLPNRIKFAGVTHPGGEIVIVHEKYLSEFAFDVHYYDPERNSRRRVEIQSTSTLLRVSPSDPVELWAVTDHIENIMRL